MKKSLIIGGTIIVIAGIGFIQLRNAFVKALIADNGKNHKYFDQPIFDTKEEAEEVLSSLIELIDEFGTTSVADLNNLTEINGTYKDSLYGWTDLSNIEVRTTKLGYVLSLPKAIEFKRVRSE